MARKTSEHKKIYQASYYKKWYAQNGRTRAVDYLEVIREWRNNHPEAAKAGHIVGHALVAGKITKPKKCSICGDIRRLIGHHDDYSKPLEVLWLCSSCHKLKHLT